MAKQNKSIAGMFLWDVEIEYWGFTSMTHRTLIIATRRKTLNEAIKKAAGHLRVFRHDYPKAKIVGLSYSGFVDA